MPSASSSPLSSPSSLPLSDHHLPTVSDTDSTPSDWIPSSPSASNSHSHEPSSGSDSESEEESFDLIGSREWSATSSGAASSAEMRLSFPDPLAEARGEEKRREEEEDGSYSFLLDAVPERKASGTISEWVRATKEVERGTTKSAESRSEVPAEEVDTLSTKESSPATTATPIPGVLRLAFIGGSATSRTALLDRLSLAGLTTSIVPLGSTPLAILLLDLSPLPPFISHLARETTISFLPLHDLSPDSPSASLDSLDSAQTVRPKDSLEQTVARRALARDIESLELGERIVGIGRKEGGGRAPFVTVEEMLKAEDERIVEAVRAFVAPVKEESLASMDEKASQQLDVDADKVGPTYSTPPSRSLLSRAILLLATALLLATLSLLDTTPSFTPLSLWHSHGPTPIPLATPSPTQATLPASPLLATLPPSSEPCSALSLLDPRTALSLINPHTSLSIFYSPTTSPKQSTRPTQRERSAERKAIRRAKRMAGLRCSKPRAGTGVFGDASFGAAMREVTGCGRAWVGGVMLEREEVTRAVRGAKGVRNSLVRDTRVVERMRVGRTRAGKEARRIRSRLVVGGPELRERLALGGEELRARIVVGTEEWRERVVGGVRRKVGRAARGLGRIKSGQVGVRGGRIFVRACEEVEGCLEGRRTTGAFLRLGFWGMRS